MEKEIKQIPPAVKTMIERSIANYCNNQGTQKLFYLLESIELMRQHFIVEYGADYTKNLFEEELKKNPFTKMQDYSQIDRFIEKSRTKVNQAEIMFQSVRGKKAVEREEVERKIASKVSPYQRELYFVFMVLLKANGMQHQYISRELLKAPDTSSFDKRPSNQEKRN